VLSSARLSSSSGRIVKDQQRSLFVKTTMWYNFISIVK